MGAVDPPASCQPLRVLGRYALYGEIASGGMATVHFGRLIGPVGFSRTVAIKRLHPNLAKDPEFVAMFVDEARLAARVRHPNVVATLDVLAEEDELFLIMEYVQGESLARLIHAVSRTDAQIPLPIVSSIMTGALQGLHAAHEAADERGEPLGIVHRDVSPQNVMVGADGIARVLDFGVAKAAGRTRTTRDGQLRGKAAYMAPEQVQGKVTRAADIYAAGVVLWEAMTGQNLFEADNYAATLGAVLEGPKHPPSERNALVSAELDALTMKALQREPGQRFATARDMARELEKAVKPASAIEVGEWVESIAGERLARRAQRVAEIESASFTPPSAVRVPALPRRSRNPRAPSALASKDPRDPPGSDHEAMAGNVTVPAPGRTRNIALLAIAAAALSGAASLWLFDGPSRPTVTASAPPSVPASAVPRVDFLAPPTSSAVSPDQGQAAKSAAPQPDAAPATSSRNAPAWTTGPAAPPLVPGPAASPGAPPAPTEDFGHVIDTRQ